MSFSQLQCSASWLKNSKGGRTCKFHALLQVFVYKGSETLSRRFRCAIGIFYGRWYLPIPNKIRLTVLVGKPISVAKTQDPDASQVRWCIWLTLFWSCNLVLSTLLSCGGAVLYYVWPHVACSAGWKATCRGCKTGQGFVLLPSAFAWLGRSGAGNCVGSCIGFSKSITSLFWHYWNTVAC